MAKGKVVYVDFRKGRRPTTGGFGGGPRLVSAVFLGVLLAELLAVAMLRPAVISSGFFGPTVIAVAVLVTLGVRRAVARFQVARAYRDSLGPGDDSPDERSGGWLH